MKSFDIFVSLMYEEKEKMKRKKLSFRDDIATL